MAIDATAGGATANSYLTIADADAIAAERLGVTAWDDSDDQERALLHATQILERFDYVGIPVTDTLREDGWIDGPPFQALKWPRVLNDRGDLIRNYAGAKQIETATIVGTITLDGNATVIVTADGLVGSPITLNVAVLNGDTAATVATKIRADLNANPDITDFFTVSGSGAHVVLTALVEAANDPTLNIAYDNGTCTGLTGDATSVDTRAGAVYAVPMQIQRAQFVIALWLLANPDAAALGGSPGATLATAEIESITLRYNSNGASGFVDGLPIEAAQLLSGLRLYSVLA